MNKTFTCYLSCRQHLIGPQSIGWAMLMLMKRLVLIEKSPAVATPAAPTTEAATPTTVESAEAKETPVESPKSEEKDTVILHTNDVHGRIVEEKGVIGDAKLATVIEQERAKSNQTTLVVDAGDAF